MTQGSISKIIPNFEVRFLLTLWNLGGTDIRKGLVNIRFSGKTAAGIAAGAKLTEAGAVKSPSDRRFLTLTEGGKVLLALSLAQAESISILSQH